jgi:drug/metabolite transporter (DMT)-like permease
VRYRNLTLFLVLAAVWGAAFMAIKAGLGTPADPGGFYDAPVLFAAVRYDVAGVLMLGYAAVVTDRPLPRGREQWTAVLVAGVLMIAAYHALLFVGERDPAVTSAVAAVVVSLSPILTTGFSRLFLPAERLTPVGLVGLLFGLAGVALLTRPTPGRLFDVNPGVVMVVLAAAAFAHGTVHNRRADVDLPVETMQAWAMLTGAGVMHVVSAGLGESPAAVAWTPAALLALAYLAVAASAGGFLVYFDLLPRLGPIEINLVSYVAPVFAALSGFLFLGEGIDAFAVAGFLVILVGFLLVKRRAIREEWRARRREVAPGGD